MVVYDRLESYNIYKRSFKKFKEVRVEKTKYSIKIDYGHKKVFLKKNVENTTNILPLISKVKNDCNKFINGQKINTVNSSDIFWYYYNEMSRKDGTKFKCGKIDLSSAYWTKALNEKILSKETNDYFNNIKFKDVDEKKASRLAALGSTATVKSVEIYDYGKRRNVIIPPKYDPNLRNLYMGICNSVAEDMQTVMGLVDGVYYYWDMIIVDVANITQVEEIFKALGYNLTIEKHTAEVFIGDKISYLCCPNKKGKLVEYPIRN